MGAMEQGVFMVSDASHRDISSPSVMEFSGEVLGDGRSPVPGQNVMVTPWRVHWQVKIISATCHHSQAPTACAADVGALAWRQGHQAFQTICGFAIYEYSLCAELVPR